MKIYRKFIYHIRLSALLCGLLATGCTKDPLQSGSGIADGARQIRLYIPASEEVVTRSGVSASECTINNAYLVQYKYNGRTETSIDLIEPVPLTKILGNGTQYPTLQLPDNARIATSEEADHWVIMCNVDMDPDFQVTDVYQLCKKMRMPSYDFLADNSHEYGISTLPLTMSGHFTPEDLDAPIKMTINACKIEMILSKELETKLHDLGYDVIKWYPNAFRVAWSSRTADHSAEADADGAYMYWYCGDEKEIPETYGGYIWTEKYIYSGYADLAFSSERATFRDCSIEEPYQQGEILYMNYWKAFNQERWRIPARGYERPFDMNTILLMVYNSTTRKRGYYGLQAPEYFDYNKSFRFFVRDVNDNPYSYYHDALENPINADYDVEVSDDWTVVSANGYNAIMSDIDAIYVQPNQTYYFKIKMDNVKSHPIISYGLSSDPNQVQRIFSSMQLSEYWSADGSLDPTIQEYEPLENNYRLEKQVYFDQSYLYLKLTTGSDLPTSDWYFVFDCPGMSPLSIPAYNVQPFEYLGAWEFFPVKGGTVEHHIQSVAATPSGSVQKPLTWTAEFVDEAGNTIMQPSWCDVKMKSGDPAIAQISVINIHDRKLRNAATVTNYDLSTQGGTTLQNTANCYIVNAPGSYCFPLVYGNAIKNGSYNERAILSSFVDSYGRGISQAQITDGNGQTGHWTAKIIWQDAQDLITNVRYDATTDQIYFDVPQSNICQGNAVIAIQSNNDDKKQIAWSWHIWVTDYVPGQPTSTTDPMLDKVVIGGLQGQQYVSMPFVLGWCGETQRETLCKLTQEKSGLTVTFPIQYYNGDCLYYQWGRKDPFPGTKVIDPIEQIVGDKDTYPAGGYHTLKRDIASIQESIADPGCLFIPSAAAGSNWIADTPDSQNLWGIVSDASQAMDPYALRSKTIYDPSPAGYQVPCFEAFSGMTRTGQESSDSSEWNIDDTFVSLIKWTGYQVYGGLNRTGAKLFTLAAGARWIDDGGIGNFTLNGYYWINVRNKAMTFSEKSINPYSSFGSGYGATIRPIREND